MSLSVLPRAPRVLFYSHDSFGLGHLRRTLNLAEALAERFEGIGMLLASGSEASLRFRLPPGLEVVKLPSVGKGERGEYTSRRLPGGFPSLVRLWAGLLAELVESYRPDLLVVDNKPLGVADELVPALRRLRAQGGRAILGLRDILDSPDAVEREWGRPKVRAALAGAYDAVCVYGSPEIYDLRQECPVPEELARHLRFVGYVARRPAAPRTPADSRRRPRVTATVGGGEDGVERIDCYLDSLELGEPAWDSILVLGPLLDSDAARSLERRAQGIPNVTVHRFVEDLPELFAASDCVVAMAGYNTVAELLAARTPCVLLPRTAPRSEQLLRARCMERAGLAQVQVRPRASELRGAVESALQLPSSFHGLPDLNGARKFCDLVVGLLEESPRWAESMSR